MLNSSYIFLEVDNSEKRTGKKEQGKGVRVKPSSKLRTKIATDNGDNCSETINWLYQFP